MSRLCLSLIAPPSQPVSCNNVLFRVLRCGVAPLNKEPSGFRAVAENEAPRASLPRPARRGRSANYAPPLPAVTCLNRRAIPPRHNKTALDNGRDVARMTYFLVFLRVAPLAFYASDFSPNLKNSRQAARPPRFFLASVQPEL